MTGLAHQSEDHTARFALIAVVVIAMLLGLLYSSGERANERRAQLAAQSHVAPQAAADEPGLLSKLVAGFQARRNTQLEAGRDRKLQLARFSALLIIGSHLWYAAAAFGVSKEWGLLVLFAPGIGTLAFTLYHWNEARPAFMGYSLGAVLALTSNLL